jgi:hypothetical protein
MKFFKRGSMMQEHLPHQASQRESEGQLDKPVQIFEFLLDLMCEHKCGNLMKRTCIM